MSSFLKVCFGVDLIAEHQSVLSQLKNVEGILRENRNEVATLKKERDEYKTKYLSMYEQRQKFEQRESVAITKIMDALQMVDAAIAEKNAAVAREKEIRGKYLCIDRRDDLTKYHI